MIKITIINNNSEDGAKAEDDIKKKKKRWRKEGTDKTEDGTKTKYNVIINNVK